MLYLAFDIDSHRSEEWVMSRVQLALNVADLDASVEFYTTLLGVAPHKLRPGYANFAVADPPLKLVLIEVEEQDRGTGTVGALNHLGVELEGTADVDAAAERLRSAGLAAFDERDTTCCYARQDKVWVHDPAGAPWELYTVTDDNPVVELADRTVATPSRVRSDDGCCSATSTEVPQLAGTAACC
jgi:catechol 2,3-dioxygenase-like lactoylglutathione lyase family enzyme